MPVPVTIWFNKGLSNIYNVVEILRAAQRPDEFRFLCSHTHPDSAALRIADHAEMEPVGLSDAAYLDYCETIIRRHEVRVFVPGKRAAFLAGARERLEAAGARLLVAGSQATINLLEDKTATYAAVLDRLRETEIVRVPEFQRVNCLAEFEAAYADLRLRHTRVCFKPAVSLYGLGFRIVTETGDPLHRLLAGEAIFIGLDEARRCLGTAERFRDLLVMQYLPGTERSVDCLAHEGRLVRGIIRRKPATSEGGQILEEHPEIERAVAWLTEQFGLTGLFNVQFKDDGDRPYLLEINARMSGGLAQACLSGVALPYWAMRLLLGTAQPEEVPVGQTGGRVREVGRAILL